MEPAKVKTKNASVKFIIKLKNVSPGIANRVILRFLFPLIILVCLDVVLWVVGWNLYGRLSLWQTFSDLDYQNILLLFMAIIALVILAITNSRSIRMFHVVKLLSMAFALDVVVWSVGWLQYSHADGYRPSISDCQLSLIGAMILVSFSFLVFASMWGIQNESPNNAKAGTTSWRALLLCRLFRF